MRRDYKSQLLCVSIVHSQVVIKNIISHSPYRGKISERVLLPCPLCFQGWKVTKNIYSSTVQVQFWSDCALFKIKIVLFLK